MTIIIKMVNKYVAIEFADIFSVLNNVKIHEFDILDLINVILNIFHITFVFICMYKFLQILFTTIFIIM